MRAALAQPYKNARVLPGKGQQRRTERHGGQRFQRRAVLICDDLHCIAPRAYGPLRRVGLLQFRVWRSSRMIVSILAVDSPVVGEASLPTVLYDPAIGNSSEALLLVVKHF